MNRIIKDIICVLFLAFVIAFLIVPETKTLFISATKAHPFIMGYFKFAVLASLGELIGIRISQKKWGVQQGFWHRAVLWGFYGMLLTLYMKIFAGGITNILETSFLNLPNLPIVFALLTSICLNSIFGPSFMTLHKITDTYVDLKVVEKAKKVSLSMIVDRIDWKTQIGFIVFKTIPFFWIPVHTINFMLPEVYRVIVSALLSIVLSFILIFAKMKTTTIVTGKK